MYLLLLIYICAYSPQSSITAVVTNSANKVAWEFVGDPIQHHSTTACTASENPWWGVLHHCLTKECDIAINPMVFPAATDSRFLRALGIRAFGFSPMRRSKILLHEHDEHLGEEVSMRMSTMVPN